MNGIKWRLSIKTLTFAAFQRLLYTRPLDWLEPLKILLKPEAYRTSHMAQTDRAMSSEVLRIERACEYCIYSDSLFQFEKDLPDVAQIAIYLSLDS